MCVWSQRSFETSPGAHGIISIVWWNFRLVMFRVKLLESWVSTLQVRGLRRMEFVRGPICPEPGQQGKKTRRGRAGSHLERDGCFFPLGWERIGDLHPERGSWEVLHEAFFMKGLEWTRFVVRECPVESVPNTWPEKHLREHRDGIPSSISRGLSEQSYAQCDDTWRIDTRDDTLEYIYICCHRYIHIYML